MGRGRPLCPRSSDVDLLGYGKSVIDFNAQIPDRAFDLGVSEQKLDGSQISRAAIDQGCFGTSQGVCAEAICIQPYACDPVGHKPSIVPGRNAAAMVAATWE